MKLLLAVIAILPLAAQTVPTVTLAGVPVTSGFEQQIPLTLSIGSAPSVTVTGTITLTFIPSVAPPTNSTGTVDDLMIKFSSGSRTINFTIPSGSTTATLNNASSITVLTGTTAGTITLTTTTLGTPSVQSIVTNAGVPFLTSVSFSQTPGSIIVTVVGFTSTRDMISGEFNFAPATTANVPQPNVAVALTGAFSTWFANTAQSNPYGTEFTLTAPFSLNTQSTVLVSVTMTLTNSKGTSSPITLSQ